MHVECSYRNLAKGPLIGSLYRDLGKRLAMEILVKRSYQETSHRDLANRTLIEILYEDLDRRPLMEILYRDLVKRAEVLLGDHFLDSLNRDRTLRSLTKIFCGDLL